MSKSLPDTYFAFEVNLERLEGRYLFDAGTLFEDEAEGIIKARCPYIEEVVSHGEMAEETISYQQEEIIGISIGELAEDNIYYLNNDFFHTILKTEKGFVCAVWGALWYAKTIEGEGQEISIFTEDENSYLITMANTPHDVL